MHSSLQAARRITGVDQAAELHEGENCSFERIDVSGREDSDRSRAAQHTAAPHAPSRLDAIRTFSNNSTEPVTMRRASSGAPPLSPKGGTSTRTSSIDRATSGADSIASAVGSEVSEAPSTGSAVHSDIKKYMQTHYNPQNDVVQRMEFMKERTMKRVLLGVWMVEILGVAIIVLGVGLKLNEPQEWFFRTHYVETFNVVLGTLCWFTLTCGAFSYTRRLYRAWKSKKRWSTRRYRVAVKSSMEHTVTWINVTSFLVSNIYVLGGKCRWFSGFVSINGTIQWTCWSAIFAMFLMHAHDTLPYEMKKGHPAYREDAIVMDLGRQYHWPKLVGFWCMEGLVIAMGVINYKEVKKAPEAGPVCDKLLYKCSFTNVYIVLIVLLLIGFITYFIGVLYYLHQSFENLKQYPYTSMRMANLNLRFQARLRGVAMGFFVICFIIFMFIGWGTCVSYLQSWLGFQSMVLVMTGVAAASTFVTSVNNPSDCSANMQIWLQEFAWSEAELPARLADRKSSLTVQGSAAEELDREAMFCFETSLKMLYWSMLAYKHGEDGEHNGITLQGAMRLYGLQHSELLHETSLDTKALLAWNEDTVVLSFRGTVSLKNVLTDMRAWYSTHPPARGHWYLGTRPFVHQGFLRSWTADGLKDKVLRRVNEVVASLAKTQGGGRVRVFVTGHSLGGALATLAALDIKSLGEAREQLDVTLYTFGAPRTGNHAFARDIAAKVPNTWNVINDQDTVPRNGKFIALYKRPGQRVLINSDGDMIVRPSFIEAAVQKKSTTSVVHHLLINYQRAHVAIIKAQFTCKRLRDGMLGVLRMAEACGMADLLAAAGVEARLLRKLHSFGEAGVPPALFSPRLARPSGRAGSRILSFRRTSSPVFNVDYDLSFVAAHADTGGFVPLREDDREAEGEGEGETSAPDSTTDSSSEGAREPCTREDCHCAGALGDMAEEDMRAPTASDAATMLQGGTDLQVDTGCPNERGDNAV